MPKKNETLISPSDKRKNFCKKKKNQKHSKISLQSILRMPPLVLSYTDILLLSRSFLIFFKIIDIYIEGTMQTSVL